MDMGSFRNAFAVVTLAGTSVFLATAACNCYLMREEAKKARRERDSGVGTELLHVPMDQREGTLWRGPYCHVDYGHVGWFGVLLAFTCAVCPMSAKHTYRRWVACVSALITVVVCIVAVFDLHDLSSTWTGRGSGAVATVYLSGLLGVAMPVISFFGLRKMFVDNQALFRELFRSAEDIAYFSAYARRVIVLPALLYFSSLVWRAVAVVVLIKRGPGQLIFMAGGFAGSVMASWTVLFLVSVTMLLHMLARRVELSELATSEYESVDDFSDAVWRVQSATRQYAAAVEWAFGLMLLTGGLVLVSFLAHVLFAANSFLRLLLPWIGGLLMLGVLVSWALIELARVKPTLDRVCDPHVRRFVSRGAPVAGFLAYQRHHARTVPILGAEASPAAMRNLALSAASAVVVVLQYVSHQA